MTRMRLSQCYKAHLPSVYSVGQYLSFYQGRGGGLTNISLDDQRMIDHEQIPHSYRTLGGRGQTSVGTWGVCALIAGRRAGTARWA